MTDAASGGVREATYWCRVFTCQNHLPRQSPGIPVGWLRVALGVTGGKVHYMTFCGPACLRATLERHPREFAFDPRIDRQRIERAKQRKQRAGAPGR